MVQIEIIIRFEEANEKFTERITRLASIAGAVFAAEDEERKLTVTPLIHTVTCSECGKLIYLSNPKKSDIVHCTSCGHLYETTKR